MLTFHLGTDNSYTIAKQIIEDNKNGKFTLISNHEIFYALCDLLRHEDFQCVRMSDGVLYNYQECMAAYSYDTPVLTFEGNSK